MLDIAHATVVRGNTAILEDITLQLRPGRLHAIIGPNGAGKSTLLKAVTGQLRLKAGQVRHMDVLQDHARLSTWQAGMAYMPQDISLDVDLSAIEVVLLGRLSNLGMHIGDELLQQALESLDTVGLLHLANRSVAQLSGGQRQMVLFAQLLMRQSALMLLDEPVSALDLKHQVRLLDILLEQTRQRHCTTLTVLHDLNLVAQYADEVIVIADRSVLAQGAPLDVMSAGFLERIYGIRTDVVTGNDGLPRVTPLRGAFAGEPTRRLPGVHPDSSLLQQAT